MKKILITLLCLAALILSANAGILDSSSIEFSPEIAMPMGDFGDIAGMGFGASIRGNYSYSEKILLSGSIGYIKFGEKEKNPGFKYTYYMIPIKSGAKYFVIPNLYLMGELGYNFVGVDYTIESSYFGNISGSGGENKPCIALGAGYRYKLNDNLTIDGSVRYDFTATEGTALTMVGIRVGIDYKFK